MNEEVREKVRKIYKKIYKEYPSPEQEIEFAREILIPEIGWILAQEKKIALDKNAK